MVSEIIHALHSCCSMICLDLFVQFSFEYRLHLKSGDINSLCLAYNLFEVGKGEGIRGAILGF